MRRSILRRSAAVIIATLAATGLGCSLDGLTGGAGGGDGPTGPTGEVTGAGPSSAAVTTTAGGPGGGAPGAGGGGSGGAGGAGGAVTSDLFAWAGAHGSAYRESTLGTDRRIGIVPAGEHVVVARVIDEPSEAGVLRDRLEVTALDPATGALHVTVSLAHEGSDLDDAIALGRMASRGSLVALPLGVRGTLDVPGGEPLATTDDDAIVIVIDLAADPVTVAPVVLGGAGNQTAQSAAFASDGDLLVGGRFVDALPCPGAGSGIPGNSGFVARIETTTGTCTRAVHFTGLGGPARGTGVRAIAVDGDVALAVGGYAYPATIGGTALTSEGEGDALHVRLDLASNGLAVRSGSARRFGGGNGDLLRDVVSIGGGAFVASGHVHGGDLHERCGGAPLPAAWHAVVLRIGPANACNWALALPTGGANGSWGARSLALAGDGRVVVGGVFRSLVPCPGAEPWLGVDADGFVLALDAVDGRPSHGARIGAQAEQTVTAVAAMASSLEPFVGGSYDQIFDPLLGDPASADLFDGRLRPMSALPCEP